MADRQYDIEKYLKGELTPAEMFALEEQALRDPFLAEALEGASQIKPHELEADLKKLQHTLADRVQRKPEKVVAFWVWPARIAAGLLLLIVSTIVVVTLTTRHSPEEDLALNKPSNPAAENQDDEKGHTLSDSIEKGDDKLLSQSKPTEAVTTPAPRDEPSEAAEIPAASPVIEKEAPRSPTETRSNDKAKIVDESIEEEIAQANPQPAAAAGELKKSEAGRMSVRKKDSRKESAAGAATDRSAQDEAIPDRIVKGQVVAKDGTGLPGVNVMVKGSNLGTVTDAAGNYQISIGRDASSLVFSFIGFTAAEVPATQLDKPIQLNEDLTSLSEVVVTGYGVSTSDDSETTYEMAAPAGGRRAFKQYLEKNLRYPAVAMEKKVEGKVTIQFTVEATGQLSDFKVVKGIGSGCDEEVIRLIQQGPTWAPAKKNNDALKDIVKVRMKFELPK
jgi:TonB family protein